MKLSRREFFRKSIHTAAILSIPTLLSSVIESCSSNPVNPGSGPASGLPLIKTTSKNNIITLSIDSTSPLAKTGNAVQVNFASGNLLVDRSDQNTFNALSAICTHQGCLITGYDPGNHQFVCPCHGSRFGLEGQVVNGPASIALPQYETQFNNNILTITV
jgi:cytochrome b6-f complex iron-sulfur subunit